MRRRRWPWLCGRPRCPWKSQGTMQDIRGSEDQGNQEALDHQDGQVRVLEELMDSMSRRLEKVIARKGASTKYWDPWNRKQRKIKCFFLFLLFYVFFLYNRPVSRPLAVHTSDLHKYWLLAQFYKWSPWIMASSSHLHTSDLHKY